MTSVLVLLAFAVAIFLYVVAVYNGLIKRRLDAENAWSQIDVQLKRRYDLIPNLVETVKGYAGHEKQTLEAVIAARNSAIGSQSAGAGERAQAENMLTGALKSVFALSEAYPDLKANQNFLGLQEELSSTENKIGFSRQHYNDSVGVYMSSLQSFPANVIAGFFKFAPKEFFQLDAAEAAEVKKVPQVKF